MPGSRTSTLDTNQRLTTINQTVVIEKKPEHITSINVSDGNLCNNDAIAGNAANQTPRKKTSPGKKPCPSKIAVKSGLLTESAATVSPISPTCPFMCRCVLCASVPILPTSASDVAPLRKSHGARDTLDADTDNDQPWQVYRSKRSRPIRNGVIIGTGNQKDLLQAVERTKKIHACFFKPETTAEAIRVHMEEISKKKGYHVDKLRLRHELYASFVMTVPESNFQLFMTSEVWPAGTEVRQWFPRDAGRAIKSHFRHTPGQKSTNDGATSYKQ